MTDPILNALDPITQQPVPLALGELPGSRYASVVVPYASGTPIAGSMSSADTPAALAETELIAQSVILRVANTESHAVYVGGEGVANASNGYLLSPGNDLRLAAADLSKLQVVSASAGNSVVVFFFGVRLS